MRVKNCVSCTASCSGHDWHVVNNNISLTRTPWWIKSSEEYFPPSTILPLVNLKGFLELCPVLLTYIIHDIPSPPLRTDLLFFVALVVADVAEAASASLVPVVPLPAPWGWTEIPGTVMVSADVELDHATTTTWRTPVPQWVYDWSGEK